ncbi:MAG: DUF72 domain-containing protein [Thermomonas sp.]
MKLSNTASHTIRIGCAGWNVPIHHQKQFGVEGTSLERYATRLDAVEINSSFYRPHQPKTYERWASSVPEHFRFSLKVPKTITHDQRLVGSSALLDRFLADCMHLGNKLGGFLVQLPPSLQLDARQATTFFRLLRRRLSNELAIACEPRHASWFSEKALAILERHGVNLVAADPAPVAGLDSCVLPSNTGAWRYWRLHGSPRLYYSNYSLEALACLVNKLLQSAKDADVWVVFDNTAHGHATENALLLERMVADQIASVKTRG